MTRNLDLMFLMSAFQLEIFYDSTLTLGYRKCGMSFPYFYLVLMPKLVCQEMPNEAFLGDFR